MDNYHSYLKKSFLYKLLMGAILKHIEDHNEGGFRCYSTKKTSLDDNYIDTISSENSDTDTVADTFIEVIQYAGAERVRDLNFTIAYDNLILTENQINPKYAIATKPLGNGFFVNTNIPTTHKAEIISEISERLGLGLIVTIE